MKKIFRFIITVAAGMSLAACSSGASADHHEEEDAHHGHEHHGESMEVELTAAQMDAVGIILGTIQQKDMGASLTATGVLEVSAQNEAVAAPMAGGNITRICVIPGQKVKAGQPIAYVESPQILVLRQEYAEALQGVERARTEYRRQEALATQGAGVKKNFDNARADLSAAELAAQNCLARLKAYGATAEGSGGTLAVTAGISGTVVTVDATMGSFADAQIPVARIVNTDAVYCRLRILEKDISRIKEGQEVEMRLTNDPGQSFTGHISEVTPVLDPETRTFPATVRIDGDKFQASLIPGMAVSAGVSLGGEKTNVLPEGAVVRAGGKSYIFILEDVEEENGTKAFHFEKVEVSTGLTSGGYTAITPLEPLEPDAQIVTAGAFYLNSMSTDHGEHSH